MQRTRSRFYLGMTLVLAAIVLTGFMPTLFGRAMFNVPKMPGHLYLHGIVLAAWFALLVTQASLVGSQLAVHRRLGWAAAGFAVLIPVVGMATQLALPDRIRSTGADLAPFVELIETIFWLNLVASMQFAGFVTAAICLRKQAESHKRLMLLASIAIIQPAAARLSRWPIFGNTASDLSQPASTGNDVKFALGATVLLLLALIVNDLRTRRRLHRVTVIGILILVGMVALAPAIAGSDWARALVWAVS
jgi:hypothetical protein